MTLRLSDTFSLSVNRRRTRREASALYASYAESGLSLREYSRQHGVAKSSLAVQVSRRRGKLNAPPSTLVPVEIIAIHDTDRTPNPALALEFPGALRLTVARDFDEDTLRWLVAALRER